MKQQKLGAHNIRPERMLHGWAPQLLYIHQCRWRGWTSGVGRM